MAETKTKTKTKTKAARGSPPAPAPAERPVAGAEQGRLLKLSAAEFSWAIACYDLEERERLSKLWAERATLLALLGA
jgi:hypothetical protein